MFDITDKNGDTMMMIAVREQCYDMVKRLLDAGASFEIVNNEGMTIFETEDYGCN